MGDTLTDDPKAIEALSDEKFAAAIPEIRGMSIRTRAAAGARWVAMMWPQDRPSLHLQAAYDHFLPKEQGT